MTSISLLVIQCMLVKQSYVESDLCFLSSLIQLLSLCKSITFITTALFRHVTVSHRLITRGDGVLGILIYEGVKLEKGGRLV